MQPPSTTTLRDLLDDALLRVRHVSDPSIDVHQLAESVSSALQQVYRALAASRDPSAFADAMVIASMEMESALEAAPPASEDGVAAAIREQIEEALRLSSHAGPPGEPLRLPIPDAVTAPLPATRGVPSVLELSRDITSPALAIREPRARLEVSFEDGPEPPPVQTLDELDALLEEAASPPEAETAGPDTPEAKVAEPGTHRPTSSAILLEYATIAIEELGCFGLQREPSDGQTWTGKERLEQRLLSRLDALAACGTDVLPALVKRLERRPLPDAEMTWALIFTYGSIAGDDMVDEAARLARAAELDDADMRGAVADALAHVPTVAIERRVRKWLQSPNAPERVAAVRALGRRGALTPDELLAAASDVELDVVRAAAAALGTTKGRIDDGTLDRLLHHEDELVVRETIRGGVARGEVLAARRARTLVRSHQGAFADAGVTHAVSHGRDALDALLEDAAVTGAPACLRALGWLGHVSAVPYLIGRLEAEDEETRRASAGALQRIAGGRAPDASSEAAEAAPQVLPQLPEGPPSEDPEAWRGWWGRAEATFDPKERYRFGAPWLPETNTRELRNERSSLAAREWSHLELSARLGVRAPLDVRAFVATQRRMLDKIEDEVRESPLRARGWPVSFHI
ncbi:MAG TPA: HEAT repeat domain-containing protein [Sandaracinaceae bacterium LLY-WYZ-13_1]|nr:HEAT repeat domain-containing protein [Sandaracinaceae bacterium LLY-WYZ-13_1]